MPKSSTPRGDDHPLFGVIVGRSTSSRALGSCEIIVVSLLALSEFLNAVVTIRECLEPRAKKTRHN